MTKQDIFNLAWELAKEAAFSFDCEASIFFTEALKIAHKQAKTHCKIEKSAWHFNTISGSVLITTPDKQEIRITNYLARTRNQIKYIFEAAKSSTYFFTADQLATLKLVSTQKY